MKARPATFTPPTSRPTPLAKVAAKNFRTAHEPRRLRRNRLLKRPSSRRRVDYPLTRLVFSLPTKAATAVVMCRADIAHRFTTKTRLVRAVEIRTRRYGASEVNTLTPPVEEDMSPTVYAARAAFEKRGSRRRMSTFSNSGTDAAPR